MLSVSFNINYGNYIHWTINHVNSVVSFVYNQMYMSRESVYILISVLSDRYKPASIGQKNKVQNSVVTTDGIHLIVYLVF